MLLSVVNCVEKLFKPVNVLSEPNNAELNKFDFTYAVVATLVLFAVITGVEAFI